MILLKRPQSCSNGFTNYIKTIFLIDVKLIVKSDNLAIRIVLDDNCCKEDT